MYRQVVISLLLSIFLLGIAGCFSSRAEDIEAFLKPDQVNVTADKYILHPPDEIEIQCSKVPELHLQIQVIRADGKVSFEALGEFDASGLTPAELCEAIKKKAASLYSLPGEHPVDVRITVSRSRVYYVLGQVYEPGPRVNTGRDTVLTAVSSARLNAMAWQERIQVVRPSSIEGKRARIFEFNYDHMAIHGDTTKNVLLEDGDIVYVPATPLAAVALMIEEFLRPIGRIFSTVYMYERIEYMSERY
ncbi:MAG: polysaccharide biosynthesis/export family protein [Planctomycetota bacterium]|jgi:protein involved in polysaccharide export with SLBB domain